LIHPPKPYADLILASDTSNNTTMLRTLSTAIAKVFKWPRPVQVALGTFVAGLVLGAVGTYRRRAHARAVYAARFDRDSDLYVPPGDRPGDEEEEGEDDAGGLEEEDMVPMAPAPTIRRAVPVRPLRLRPHPVMKIVYTIYEVDLYRQHL